MENKVVEVADSSPDMPVGVLEREDCTLYKAA